MTNYFNAYLGLSLSVLFTMLGTCFSTIKATSLLSHKFSSFIPIIMSSILAIYSLIINIIIIDKINHQYDDNALMAAALVIGFSNLFSGITMGYINDKAAIAGIEMNFGILSALMFSQFWGLCGLITSLILLNQ